MDCLDEPLHLRILTSSASSSARHPPTADLGHQPQPTLPGDLDIITGGLPETSRSTSVEVDDDDRWDEVETNHAISYAHYIASLPSDSPFLAESLGRLRELLEGLVRLAETSASSSSSHDATGLGTTTQAHACEGSLKAILWVGWSHEGSREEVGTVFSKFFTALASSFEKNVMTFPLVLLQSAHLVLSTCPLPLLPPSVVPEIASQSLAIASSTNLLKLLNYIPLVEPFVAPHPLTPGGVVMLVSEMTNIFLTSTLLTPLEPTQAPFATTRAEEGDDTVQAEHMRRLLAEPSTGVEERQFSHTTAGAATSKNIQSEARKWLADVLEPVSVSDQDGGSRRGSLFVMGGGAFDEEIELTVTISHLSTVSTLHLSEPEASHMNRSRVSLSEDSTASDPRVLEAAFFCTSIIVRNHPGSGTSMTLHIRRLLMSPLPAFEGEMAACGGNVPPAVVAGSKCLAICIEVSSNDDLISSTLYSLLNTLSHSGSTIPAGGAVSVRSHPASTRDGEHMTTRTNWSGGRITEEQRRSVAVTAVEVVSRLALETGRDDIIHLSISLLLQRLRGVDIVTEATIVANLVPLALAASKSDVYEVSRAFSQISRTSHPEDPRISSNSVLAAQSKLARGLANRSDCAESYSVESSTSFADKGTQTQMIAMSAASYESRDKEKSAQFRQEAEARVSDMKAWLAGLLIPISELLAHEGYHPERDASPELVGLFRNFWFLCVVFGISGQTGKKKLSEHAIQALGVIAEKTPALVSESANDYVDSDSEYNSILRKDFASSIQSKQRSALAEYLPGQKHSLDIRSMTTAQTTLLMAIYDSEEARTSRARPSVISQYFCNESINSSSLIGCLDAISHKISSGFLKQLSRQVVTHSMPPRVAEEVCRILVACTHRFRKVREVASGYARQILETFSALLCDRQVVFTSLEISTLMRRSCEMQYTDEYSPVHEFKSDKVDITSELTDDYAVRNEITTQLHGVARQWLTLAISRAPIEVQSTLQTYLNESRDVLLIDSVEMGAGLALHYSKAISKLDRQETIMPNIGGWPSDSSNLVASQFAAKNYFNGESSGARLILGQGSANLQQGSPTESSLAESAAFKSQMAKAVSDIRAKSNAISIPEIRRSLSRASSVLASSSRMDSDIVHYLVELPMTAFTPLSIAAGVDAWTWSLRQRPEAEIAVLGEISAGWLETIHSNKGLFSTSMNYKDPFETPVEYAPSDKKVMDSESAKARKLSRPHSLLTQVSSSQFQAVKYREPGIMVSLIRLMMRSLWAAKKMSTHPSAREVRFSSLLFGFQISASARMEALLELRFRDRSYNAAFAWFSVRPQWSFGSDRIQVGAEIRLLQEFSTAIGEDHIRGDHSTSSMSDRPPALSIRGSTSLHDYTISHRDRVKILQSLVESEINRLSVWCNPTNEPGRTPSPGAVEKSITIDEWTRSLRRAWDISPAMTVHMGERFKLPQVQAEITQLVRKNPQAVIDVAEALHFLLGDRLDASARSASKWSPVWAALPPVTALVYFQPRYGNHPLISQYAMRVLEQHPVELTFFFVPQVVQALRVDGSGYVERFIFETSKISQSFCHQIIWNMKANTYRDDDASQPDPMKPSLDRMIDMIVAGSSGKARDFYDLEFNFFDAVTSISGKLKPYIKKSKPEKKAKIDEEMQKIELSVGVYLPSNPDGEVVDSDRKSGRPSQSHAKAPFMATFKVQKEKSDIPSGSSVEMDEGKIQKKKYDVWQSAIFKVGDDCRQDVLASQVIAMFKNVFTQIGSVLYLFPYRVTATAPGCGVIDVVPNATSRDEMGRAKINDSFGYFVDKYGGVDTVPFQKARLNFIQSMAAYSVACYISQIKDRHNGNIMIDGEGHIVHIDFGFSFDIGPGGVKFEPNSFKSNHEMVTLMGGRDSQGYRMFTELTVKAFLAIRPHADQLCDTCHLMLGTELPSFKGEGTIKRSRDRFQSQSGERQAAEYMMGVIRNAHENMRSNVYDGFQKSQNGIPY